MLELETKELENRVSRDKYLDSISEQGLMTLGSKMKRTTDLIMSQVQELYRQKGINCKPTWFPFLLCLKHAKYLDQKSIAQRLSITPSAVSQALKELEKHGLVKVVTEKLDQRQKQISLSDKGLETIYSLVPHLQIIEDTMKTILGNEINTLLSSLEKINNKLEEKPFAQRSIVQDDFEIIEFQKKYAKDFLELNKAWLEKYFVVEKHDAELLENPQSKIIDPGGKIFFAIHDEEVISTIALIRIDDRTVEISKMATNELFQGRGIGRKLLGYALDECVKQGYKEAVIQTDSVLKPAVKLYKSFGFEEFTNSHTPYSHRGDLWFKKQL